MEEENQDKEACPLCAAYGGYCGGSGHQSCGCFIEGRPVSLQDYLSSIEEDK